MANQSTPIKLIQKVKRERVEQTDLELATRQALTNTEVHTFELICDFPCTIRGMKVEVPTGSTVAVTPGAAVVDGQLMKLLGNSLLSLNPNLSTAERKDTVLINGYNEQDSDLHNPRVLSALTVEGVTDASIGSGDGVKTRFELLHSQVDLSTLVVKVGGVQVAGWVFSKGTGTTLPGVDEILFASPPSSQPITVSYKWLNGGIEGTMPNQPSRKTTTPILEVRQGQPASAFDGSGNVVLAEITLPAGWVSGSTGVTVDNSVKSFLVGPDSENTVGTPSVLKFSARPGGLIAAIRNIDQVCSGLRLHYSDTDKVKVTPGWGVLAGHAFSVKETTEFTINTTSVGWHYLYLRPSELYPAGTSVVRLEQSTTPPDSFGRDRTASFYNMYVGAVFIENIDVGNVIRPFYRDGDWTMWSDARFYGSLLPSTSPKDIDVSESCPATAGLLHVRTYLAFTPSVNNTRASFDVRSHRVVTGRDDPQVKLLTSLVSPPSSEEADSSGFVKPERTIPTRLIHFTISSGGSPEGSIYVQGYRDDYRTMNDNGLPSSY